MGAPPTKNSVAARYLQDKSFVEMDVRAKRKNGTPIRLRPGSAKYPAESTFNKVSEGMCGHWITLFFVEALVFPVKIPIRDYLNIP